MLALSWALEVGEPERFDSIRRAISYCGLCAAQKQSGAKTSADRCRSSARGPTFDSQTLAAKRDYRSHPPAIEDGRGVSASTP